MNSKQKLRKELDESGAVIPTELLPKLYAPTEAPKQEVVQVIEFGPEWHSLAVQKMKNFFDSTRQLREVYRANGKTCLRVAFNDQMQAQAFAMALQQGQFGGPKRN